MAVGTALLAASVGQGLWNAFSGARKEKKRARKKSNYFDEHLSPLLNEATREEDVDFSSIYDAEMAMPLANLQQGMRSISRTNDATMGQSGFASSGFVENDYENQTNILQDQFSNQKFQSQRGIIDLQSQLESITTENKIRAKELEYQYKYG